METVELSKNQQKKLAKMANKQKDKEQVSKQNIQSAEDYYLHRKATVDKTYPNFVTSLSLQEFRDKYSNLENGEFSEEREDIMGRVITVREASSKLTFFDLQNGLEKLQCIFNLHYYFGENPREIISSIKRGDIIGVKQGIPHRTPRGELSIIIQNVQVVSPCLYILPDTVLADPDVRFRKRYLDFICNPSLIQTFIDRNKIKQFIRNYLDTRGYIDVETPMLCLQPSGANARPFKAYHNDSGQDVFLRIAPEIPLKMLISGGFNKVYDMNTCFRNEGADLTHNPSFTTIELYEVGKNFDYLISMIENIFTGLSNLIRGSLNFEYNGHQINMSAPFLKIDAVPYLEKLISEKLGRKTNIPLIDNLENTIFLKDLCDELQVKTLAPFTLARLIDSLIAEYIEPLSFDRPVLICGHPRCLSPLAKPINDTEITLRTELFIAGKEYCNGYEELVNPFIQEENFRKQAENKDIDDEIVPTDHEFVKCLEYGNYPMIGLGIGIDRLCMLLTNNTNIQEVLLFPLMKGT